MPEQATEIKVGQPEGKGQELRGRQKQRAKNPTRTIETKPAAKHANKGKGKGPTGGKRPTEGKRPAEEANKRSTKSNGRTSRPIRAK